MTEIKCPKCGTTFKIDDNNYIAIVNQIRETELAKELARHAQQHAQEKEMAVKLAQANASQEHEKAVAEYAKQITELKAQLAGNEKDKALALNEAMKATQQLTGTCRFCLDIARTWIVMLFRVHQKSGSICEEMQNHRGNP